MPCAHGRGVLASASAWAVRPSAASRRARFSVGVGCPSFGGQRSVGSHFGLPPAKLVKELKPWRYLKVQQCLRSQPELGAGAATVSVLPSWRAAETETAAVPVLHSQSSVSRVASPISLRRPPCTASPSRLVHLLCLTPPSRGRPAGRPPLTSNVRPHDSHAYQPAGR
jgi:hypothetical protein